MIPSLSALKKQVAELDPLIYQKLIAEHGEKLKVKPTTAVKNLAKIVDATLSIANDKGFQAMSLRDLSATTGMSMGGLYAYIESKDDLVHLIQHHGQLMVGLILEANIDTEAGAGEQLRQALATHLYLSELQRPWFYFSYMEAKNLPEKDKREAIASEQSVDDRLRRIIDAGIAAGEFRPVPSALVSAHIKALLQDWYLKRGKYKQRKISLDDYLASVCEMVFRLLA